MSRRCRAVRQYSYPCREGRSHALVVAEHDIGERYIARVRQFVVPGHRVTTGTKGPGTWSAGSPFVVFSTTIPGTEPTWWEASSYVTFVPKRSVAGAVPMFAYCPGSLVPVTVYAKV